MTTSAQMDFFQFAVDNARAQAAEILAPAPMVLIPNFQTGEFEEFTPEEWFGEGK